MEEILKGEPEPEPELNRNKLGLIYVCFMAQSTTPKPPRTTFLLLNSYPAFCIT
jgi:hypothetical protein